MSFPLLAMLTNVVGSPDTEAPTVPQNLVATASSSSQIDLTWSASADNVGVTGYRIYRVQGTGTPDTLIDTVASSPYSDTGLGAETQYNYHVTAVDEAGNESAPSNEATDTTAAAAPTYADTVTGRSGGAPLAYWRCSDAATLLDEQAGSRDGTFTGTPSLVAALPADSDQALDFPGAVHAEVADDAGLHLAELSVSGWLKVTGTPTTKIAVWSKDASGLNDGDFALTIDDELTLGVQFQDASTEYPIETTINLGDTHQWAVFAGAFGFDFFLDGKHVGRNTGFTAGWTNNTQAIQFAKAPWTTEELVGVLDEVALYDYALTDADVVALSQVSGDPVAAEPSLVVTESTTLTYDPFSSAQCVGRKADLTVEVSPAGAGTWGSSANTTHGTATVNVDNDIEFAADEVTQNETDSFDYRITDANGTSAAATVSLEVNDSTDVGGGTLVYEWAPLGTWIDGEPLANRDNDFVTTLARWTDSSAATVGSSLPKSIPLDSGRRDFCFNRAPTGEPAIEVHSEDGQLGVMNFAVQLYDHLGAGSGPWPRHLRAVFEVKTCKSSDATTHKADGLGTTGGSYPDWGDTHSGTSDTATKYFAGLYAGDQPGGGGNVNWWDDHTLDIDRAGYRMVSGSGSKTLKTYSYNFDRPGQFGGSNNSFAEGTGIADAGIEGVWHRLEIEVFLCTPQLAEDADARRVSGATRPTGGDGYVKYYVTKDIDGELGAPGNRTLVAETLDGLISFPWRDDTAEDLDDMHTLANLGGPWFCMFYGGSTPAQAEGWAWIRKLQVYRHD